MIKSQIKYLIILCVALYGVIGQLGTNNTDSIYDSPVKQSGFSQNLPFSVQQGNATFISSSFVFNNRENFLFDYDEKFEDDDDKENIASQKKNTDNLFALSSLFYNHCNRLFSLEHSKVLHFSKPFSFILSNKLFIIFQVFRV